VEVKHYVKNLYSFSLDSGFDSGVPDFIGQREGFVCPHCEKGMVVAVPATSVDWETVAKQYKDYSRRMWIECNKLLAEAGVDTLLEAKLKELLQSLRKNMDL
jgi:hypothetical protein